LRLGNEKYHQDEFAEYLAKNQSINAKETIKQFVDRSFEKFIDDKAIEYKDARLEEKYPEFKALVNEYRDGILLFELTDQKVWSKAIRDTTGLRLDAILITSSTKDAVEKAHAMANQRMSVDQMREAFKSDESQDISVLEKKFPKGEDSIIDKVKWEKGVSQVITETDDRHGFVVIKGKVKPEHKTLSEARGIITADYQNFLEQEWLKELKQKYTVTVNQDVLYPLSFH